MMENSSEAVQTPPAVASIRLGNKEGIAKDSYDIFPKQEFQIVRANVQQLLKINDTVISHKHINIRCVQFDENYTSWGVPPMIYVENTSRNGSRLERTYVDSAGYECTTTKLLAPATAPVPFLHGDKIFLNRQSDIYVQLLMYVDSHMPPISTLMAREIEMFEEEYKVTPQVIGCGGHGRVYVAFRQSTQSPFACKVVSLHGADILQHRMKHRSSAVTALPGEDAQAAHGRVSGSSLKSKLHSLEVEYDILKDLDHPNIIAVQQVFITAHHIYIIQELITGGDLLSFMEYKGWRLNNAESAVITFQILRAVEYLHDRGIVHRDIKPDNILMRSWKGDARVVLTDFGHSKRTERSARERQPLRMFTTVGTVGYSAPEMHKQNHTIPNTSGYSSAIDMWSIGTITALLLTGEMIFPDQCGTEAEWDSRQQKLRAAARCDLSMIDGNKGEWSMVTKKAKEFVKNLLVLKESKRLTAKQALQHPWLNCDNYRADLERVYESAIADWKPRNRKDSIVRTIDTSFLAPPTPTSSSPRSSSPPMVSTYFNETTLHASGPAPSSSHRGEHQDQLRQASSHYVRSLLQPQQQRYAQQQQQLQLQQHKRKQQEQSPEPGLSCPPAPVKATTQNTFAWGRLPNSLELQDGSPELGTWPKTLVHSYPSSIPETRDPSPEL